MANRALVSSAAIRTAMLTSAGAGIGLMPAVARRLAADPPVGWLRLDAPGCRRTLSLVWRTDAYLSAAARALAEFAPGYFRTWHGGA
jgi:DNA-binding transcriptional LysR family regulator